MSFLVARPEPKAQATQAALQAAGFCASVAPLVSIEINTSNQLEEVINTNTFNTIIITSSYAVDWLTQQALTINLNPLNIICVGQGTAKHLQSSPVVLMPTIKLIVPELENSEGILDLPLLQDIKEQHILILKGEGGRTLLANTLQKRGAQLIELCVYKRLYKKQSEMNKHFKAEDIRCIIVTSVEIAHYVLLAFDKDWLQNLHWIVASERIKDYAIQQNIRSIYLSQGASHQAIVDCATHLVHTGALND